MLPCVRQTTNPRELLDRHGIHPKRALGQNFLHDPGALNKIVAAADLAPEETVLEIGAGTGTLTQALLKTACPVIAVESDARLLPLLRAGLPDTPQLRLGMIRRERPQQPECQSRREGGCLPDNVVHHAH